MVDRLADRAGVTLAAGALAVAPEWVVIAIREAGNGFGASAGYAWRTIAIACVLPACWLLAESGFALAPRRFGDGIAAALHSLWRRPVGHVLAYSLFTAGTFVLIWAIAVSLWKDLDLPYWLPGIPWEIEVRRLTARIPMIAVIGAGLGAVVGMVSGKRLSAPARPPWLMRRLGAIALGMGLGLSVVNVARPIGFFATFHPVLLVLAFWSYLLGLRVVRATSGRSASTGSATDRPGLGQPAAGRGGRVALTALPAAAAMGVWLLATGLGGPSATSLRMLDHHRPLAAKLAVAAFASSGSEPVLVCPSASVSGPPPASPSGDRGDGAAPDALPADDRPDLLFVTVDALSAHHVGSLGYSRAVTPNLDRLAAEGASFTAARSTGSATEIGIAGIHFSRPFECMPAEGDALPSIFSTLSTAGYRRAAFYGYPMGAGVTTGYASPLLEPFDRREFLGDDADFPNTYSTDARVAAAALDELSTAPADQPLALWLHFYDPHPVYNPTPSTRGRFGRGQVDRYDEEVLATDAAFGDVWNSWSAARPGRDLAVVVTADHGQALHELGQHGHATSLVYSMVHVPLILAGPGIVRVQVTRPVSTLDIGPTALDMLGLPAPESFMGESLLPDLADARPDEPVWMTRGNAGRVITEAVVLGRYKLYREARPRYALLFPEAEYFALYDVVSDPAERHNLIDEDPEQAARLKPLLLSRVYAGPEGGG